MKETNLKLDVEKAMNNIFTMEEPEVKSNYAHICRDINLLRAAIEEQVLLKKYYEIFRIDYIYLSNLIAKFISQDEAENFQNSLPDCCEAHRQQYAIQYFSERYNDSEAVDNALKQMEQLAELLYADIQENYSNKNKIIH